MEVWKWKRSYQEIYMAENSLSALGIVSKYFHQDIQSMTSLIKSMEVLHSVGEEPNISNKNALQKKKAYVINQYHILTASIRILLKSLQEAIKLFLTIVLLKGCSLIATWWQVSKDILGNVKSWKMDFWVRSIETGLTIPTQVLKRVFSNLLSLLCCIKIMHFLKDFFYVNPIF